MESMQHMHYQYAGQYWLTQALRNASGVLTDNIDEACLVWVDTYCYQQVSSLCPGRLVGAAGKAHPVPSRLEVHSEPCCFSRSLVQWWWIQKAIKFRSDWLKGYTHNESHVSNIYAQALDYATTSEQFQVHSRTSP